MLKTINYLRGSVRVEVEGAFPERFLNLCSQNGIGFWNLERPSPEILLADMHIKSFRRLAPFAKRAMCKIKLKGKNGIRFFLWRFRKRYALVAGLFLCAAALWMLSQHVWDIEVTGAQTIPIDDILNALAEEGVAIGSRVNEIDEASVKNNVLLRIDGLSWLTINIKGSRASVEVRERIYAPEMIPREEPCNIVAGKGGVVTRMDVMAGSPQVIAGQTVVEGQLLVSGIIDSGKVGARFVHSLADIRARTWYNITAASLVSSSGKRYTGAKTIRNAIIIGETRINLYFDTGKVYEHYDKITNSASLTLSADMPLPVTLVTEEYHEYEPYEAELDLTGLEERMAGLLEQMLKKEITGEIVEGQSMEPKLENGVLYLSVSCEAEERIGLSTPIPGGE